MLEIVGLEKNQVRSDWVRNDHGYNDSKLTNINEDAFAQRHFCRASIFHKVSFLYKESFLHKLKKLFYFC